MKLKFLRSSKEDKTQVYTLCWSFRAGVNITSTLEDENNKHAMLFLTYFYSRTEKNSEMGKVITGTCYNIAANGSRTSFSAPVSCG